MKSESFPIRLSHDIGKGRPLPHRGRTFSGMRSICHSAQIFWLLQEHKAELHSGGQSQDLPSKIGKDVAQDAVAALGGRQGIEPFGTLVAPDWSRAPVVSPQALEKVEQGGEMMIASNIPCFPKSLLRSLLWERSIQGLHLISQHLEVVALCSAELLQAALHVPPSGSTREKAQHPQGPLSCHRCRRWRSSRMRLGRPRSGIRTLRIGSLAGRRGALMSWARPKAYRAHMGRPLAL